MTEQIKQAIDILEGRMNGRVWYDSFAIEWAKAQIREAGMGFKWKKDQWGFHVQLTQKGEG